MNPPLSYALVKDSLSKDDITGESSPRCVGSEKETVMFRGENESYLRHSEHCIPNKVGCNIRAVMKLKIETLSKGIQKVYLDPT